VNGTPNHALIERLAPILAVLWLTACGGNPLDITDCHDSAGRGSTAPNILKLSCTPAGSNVRCQAIADNSASLYVYCPVSADVTPQASWMSSDPSVASFDPGQPGLLRALASGLVAITAGFQGLPLQSGSFAFFVSPSVNAERAVTLNLRIFGPNSTPLSDARVTAVPERGPMVSCTTKGGSCSSTLYVLGGDVGVTVEAAGFQPLVTHILVDGTHNSYFQTQRLDLEPAV
jgi:hypothetical protein